MNNIPPNFNNYFNYEFYEPAQVPAMGGGALYTFKMLAQIQQIVTLIPGDKTEIDISKLPPKELFAILKDRIDTFMLTSKINNQWDFFIFWKEFMKMLRALETSSTLAQIAKDNIDMIKNIDVLQDCILGWICLIPETHIATFYNNPKFILDDLKLLQKIRHIQVSNGFNPVWSWSKELQKKLINFQRYYLDVLRNETPYQKSILKTSESAQDYEMMCDFLEFLKKCDYYDKDKLTKKFKDLILGSLFYSKSTDRIINLDHNAFTATTHTSLVRFLEDISAKYPPVNDNQFLSLLEQFQKIMSESNAEVRKIYHRFKVNILKQFAENHARKVSPNEAMNILVYCIREMADNGDKNEQDDIDRILIPILEKIRPILEKIQFGQDLEKLTDTCISLLKINSLKANKVVSKSIDFTDINSFNDTVASSICSRESVWSGRGTKSISGIKHSDIERFVAEYKNYKRKIKNLGATDKRILVKGEVINYHSSMIPQYVMNEMLNDESISTKGVKAILYGFYCGWSEDSALFKHWNKDWVHVVKQLHPEVAEYPEDFFKQFFYEELDSFCEKCLENTTKDFGPADVLLKIEGKEIPAHREVLKSYCDLLPQNFFSALFSGIYQNENVIHLDPPLTFRGVSMMLIDIYKVKGIYPIKISGDPKIITFLDECKSACEYFGIDLHHLNFDQHKDYDKLLFDLRLRHLLNETLSNNPSEIAKELADLYVKCREGKLVHMCQEAFRVAKEKSIHIPGTVESLIKHVQRWAYPNSDLTILQYSEEEVIQYHRYMIEHLAEGELENYFESLHRERNFPLGKKGKAFCRKKAFDYMNKLISVNAITYEHFNKHLTELIFFMSFADVQELTPEELQIVHDMVSALQKKLPKIMLVGRMIDLKNDIMKQWAELNQRMGTKIPFEIDFTPK